MALKNMEYKAIDDSAKRKEEAAGAGAAAGAGLEADAADERDVRGFMFGRLAARRPELLAELSTFRDALLSAAESDGAGLAVWDMKDLGLQAAQRVAGGADPLRLLAELSGSFPALAASLSRLRLNASFEQQLAANQRLLRAGSSALLLNGQPLDLERLDVFALADIAGTELRFAAAVQRMGLPAATARAVAGLPDAAGAALPRLNFSAAPALWANDIASDAFAARWPRSLSALLQPRFPGRLPSVRRNLFNALFVADPASAGALASAEAVEYYLAQGLPLRFGLLPCAPPACGAGGDAAAADGPHADAQLSRRVARLLEALAEAQGPAAAWRFLAAASAARKPDPAAPPPERGAAPRRLPLSWAACEAALASVVSDKAAATALAAASAPPAAPDALDAALSARGEWAAARGLGGGAQTLLFNGLPFTQAEVGAQPLDYVAVLLAGQEAQALAEAVYNGKLAEEGDAVAFLLADALPTLNPAVLGARDAPPPRVAPFAPQPLPGARVRYLAAPGNVDAVAAVTHLLVGDLGDAAARAAAAAGFAFLAGGGPEQRSRLGLLHAGGGEPGLLAAAALAAAELPSRRAKLPAFLAALLRDERAAAAGDAGDADALAARAEELAAAAGLAPGALAAALAGGAEALRARLRAQAAAVRGGALGATAALAASSSAAAVLSNGRLTALPAAAAAALRVEDWSALETLALRGEAEAVAPLVEAALAAAPGAEEEEEPAERLSDAIASACALLAQRRAAASADARRQGGGGGGLSAELLQHLSFEGGLLQSAPDALLAVEGVLDPLSAEAQRVAPLLLQLRAAMGEQGLQLRIALNPGRELADMPLRAYYQFAFAAPAALAAGGRLTSAPQPAAHFSALPPSRTLTLGADVPESWLVAQLAAPADLDNLRLEDLGRERGLSAAFQLQHLLVAGHASEAGARAPPRGVQLTLGALAPPHASVGTIVMSNLGYFQLKASPGLHALAVAPGRSQLLYDELSVSDVSPRSGGHSLECAQPPLAEGAPRHGALLAVADFSGRLLRAKLRKAPGMADEDVLEGGDEEEEAGGLWGRAKSLLRASAASSLPALPAGEDNSKIHIFSVASGHLYERFLKIMILSVLRHTKTPVKFWFIENYASPAFRAFLPAYAAQYGFEYELVTYKWPTWLNKQTEKQRIIWAYKVLFLDVLFPLTLRKVIFVDADQIVRTDMRQLMELDLKGAPLGYTPMCDNEKAMDGFRFWKQGFWKDHLRGRPYHISALYVVDLAALRQQAAGDQFRIIYENLSKDPNSLANLDQDLPNYAQHQVRIHSLPQEWLWCESWCGNATKAAAKTIDLCNNPMTKEPKLEGARRIVAEWEAYDNEARAFTAALEARLEKGEPALAAAHTEL